MRTTRIGLRASLMLAVWACPVMASGSAYEAGLVAGLNRANLNGDPVPETTFESSTSFLVGGSLGVRLREDIGLSLEPSYVRRGGNAVKVVDDRNDVFETTEIDLDYLELPLLLRVRGAARARPFALGGLGLGVLLDATGHPPGGGSMDLSSQIRPTDVFAYFGGGVEASVGGQPVWFEARFTQGLNNANQGGSTGATPMPAHFKNAALQVVAGWRMWP